MNNKNKKILAIILALLVIVTIVIVWLFYPRPAKATSYNDDFESGLDNWTTHADVPIDPNTGQPVAWQISLSTNQSKSASHAMTFTIDGLQDDGAIWIQRKLNLQPNEQHHVNVTFQFWSQSESFNILANVIGAISKDQPQAEADLKVLGAANQVEGWKTYSFSATVTADGNGNAYVALGIAVTWETTLTYFVDDVNITID